MSSSAPTAHDPSTRPTTRPPTWLIWVALGIVYVIWSTTYLGIRITNETLPPLIAAGTRFVIAGAVLFAVAARRRGAEGDPVARTQWWAAFLVGAGLIAGGNGSVVLAERTVPSGTVALIFALVPLWIALWDRFVGRQRLPLRVAVDLVLGSAGAVLLVDDARLGGVPLSGSRGAHGVGGKRGPRRPRSDAGEDRRAEDEAEVPL